MTGGVKSLNSKSELDAAVKSGVSVLHFWASWCEPSKAMEPVLAQLAVDCPQAHFFRVEAEEQADISDAYDVGAVPYFLFMKDGTVVDKLQGADAPELANKVAKWAGDNTSVSEAVPASLGLAAGSNVIEAVKKDLAPHVSSATSGNSAAAGSLTEFEKGSLLKLINSNPIMLFMKGTPEAPRCGFSRKVVDALVAEGLQFGSFDILTDDIVRQGLKTYSNWPTYPQLYVKGELLGGCDIILEMKENGELKEVLEEKGGLPAHSEHRSSEAAGEVVTEPAVHEEKTTSEAVVSTLPDQPTEESAGGSNIQSRLEQLTKEHPIMLFMKGNPSEPRCKFSRKVVQALNEAGLEFGSFDILSDETVRQGLKEYSNWPTYPQLYVKGEFIGGCDIVLEMHKNGELNEVLQNA
jgi:Grx4 family monothiol glutaredoxin